MIPKIIHYCWFGEKSFSNLEISCMDSWKRLHPDYEFKLWNESNFDFSSYRFSREAYKLGKYAFVADVCRLHVLHMEGGVYLDTDMLVLKTLDDLLENEVFLGEENEGLVNAAIIGSKKGNPIINGLLEKYREIDFNSRKPLDIPKFLNLNLDRSKVKIYPKEYFYPLPFSRKGEDYRPYLTPESSAVHLWNHSWKNEWSYLHDKSFFKALACYFERIRFSPKSLIGDSFPIDFIKYFLAEKFSGLYQIYKTQRRPGYLKKKD